MPTIVLGLNGEEEEDRKRRSFSWFPPFFKRARRRQEKEGGLKEEEEQNDDWQLGTKAKLEDHQICEKSDGKPFVTKDNEEEEDYIAGDNNCDKIVRKYVR